MKGVTLMEGFNETRVTTQQSEKEARDLVVAMTQRDYPGATITVMVCEPSSDQPARCKPGNPGGYTQYIVHLNVRG